MLFKNPTTKIRSFFDSDKKNIFGRGWGRGMGGLGGVGGQGGWAGMPSMPERDGAGGEGRKKNTPGGWAVGGVVCFGVEFLIGGRIAG